MAERPGWFGNPKSRRLAVASFEDEMLLHLFRPGQTYRVEEGDLPDDARVVGVEYSVMRGWQVYLESPSFDEVPENALPPEIATPRIYPVEGACHDRD